MTLCRLKKLATIGKMFGKKYMCWFALNMSFVMRYRMLGAVFVNLMSSTRSLGELVVRENYLDC